MHAATTRRLNFAVELKVGNQSLTSTSASKPPFRKRFAQNFINLSTYRLTEGGALVWSLRFYTSNKLSIAIWEARMSHLYFDLTMDDEHFPDPVGETVTDLTAAHARAVLLVRRVMMFSEDAYFYQSLFRATYPFLHNRSHLANPVLRSWLRGKSLDHRARQSSRVLPHLKKSLRGICVRKPLC